MSNRKEAEKAALNQLERFGTDTERDHPMEFFLYFPSELNAYKAAAQLFNLQFQVRVGFSESAGDWLCLTTKEIKPTSDRILELSNFMEQLAEANNGVYDGWGTPVISQDFVGPDDE